MGNKELKENADQVIEKKFFAEELYLAFLLKVWFSYQNLFSMNLAPREFVNQENRQCWKRHFNEAVF